MKSQFDNRIKSVTRGMVMSYFRKWSQLFRDQPHQTMTAYTLPADIWEMEQFIVNDVIDTKKNCSLYLRCFERDSKVYEQNVYSRRFMLKGATDNDRLNVDYEPQNMHHNLHTKKNFFMWADFCGCPTDDALEVVLHPDNFRKNSLVFVTFACTWRRCDSIPKQLLKLRNTLFKGYHQHPNKKGHHSSKAIEQYILKKIGGCNVFPICNLEYVAGNVDDEDKGGIPMCLLGFTNQPAFAKRAPYRDTVNWFKTPVRKADRKVITELKINACSTL